jgi:hypothetical protein
MKIGNNNWMESINEGEQVNIIVRKTDITRNGTPYLQANLADDARFFMANISEGQASELEGAGYAVMTCTGHSAKGYPYLQFNVVDDFKLNPKGEFVPVGDYTEESPIEEITDEPKEGDVYPLEELEDDLRKINRRIRVALDDVDFNWKYECICKVQDDVVDALAVIYKNKLKTGDVQ